MRRSEMIKAIQEVLAEKKRPGLWANIRAKRARGEKPAHKNSNAHKDAVKAGKKINKEGLWANINAKKKAGKKSSHGNSNAHKDAVKAGNAMKKEGFFANLKAEKRKEQVRREISNNWQDNIGGQQSAGLYKSAKQMLAKYEKSNDEIGIKVAKGYMSHFGHTQETKGAPAGHYFTKSGNLVKGTMSADAKERGARKSDPKDKTRSKVPKVTQYTETSDPKNEKDREHQGSNYKWPMSKATKDRKEADKKANKK